MAIIWSWWKVNPNPCQPHLPIHLSHLSIQGAAVDSCYSLPPGVSLTNAPMILGYTWCVGISGYQINRLGKYFTASGWQDPLNKMSPWDSLGVSPPMIGHMSKSTMFKPTRIYTSKAHDASNALTADAMLSFSELAAPTASDAAIQSWLLMNQKYIETQHLVVASSKLTIILFYQPYKMLNRSTFIVTKCYQSTAQGSSGRFNIGNL